MKDALDGIQGRPICPGTYECFEIPSRDRWGCDLSYSGRLYTGVPANLIDIRFLDGIVASQHGRFGLKIRPFPKGNMNYIYFPNTAGAIAVDELVVFPWVELDLNTSPVSVRLQYPDCIPDDWIPLPNVQIIELDGVLGLLSEVTEEDYAIMQQRLEQYLKAQEKRKVQVLDPQV